MTPRDKLTTIHRRVIKELANYKALEQPITIEHYKKLLSFAMEIKLKNIDHFYEKYNVAFKQKELERYTKYFDTVESKPLTPMQREAVIVNERANLIIAGAGSGKTSVMIARVGYLLQKYAMSPTEILVLAYNKKAAMELSERIQNRLQVEGVAVSTFHALGLNLLGNYYALKPSMAPWADDSSKLYALIDALIAEVVVSNAELKKSLNSLFAYPFSTYKEQWRFETEMEYKKYIVDNAIISLKGDKVKSYEECMIANFLFLNGIDYGYETPYKFAVATQEYQQYRPDFYLIDYGIYIEHFGIAEDGTTAPFVDNQAYLEGMEWKRGVHAQNETVMIETYSYQKSQGTLLSLLQRALESKNVVFSPIDPQEALALLNDKGKINLFSELIATFIGHLKSNQYTFSALRVKGSDDKRFLTFLDICEPIYHAYEAHKRALNVIDYEDMILDATKAIYANPDILSAYKYILVDEFQDISIARAKFIKALFDTRHATLTAVGDDWQSIYRFAGSDIAVFHQFETYFGHTQKVALDYTFRYDNTISSVSSHFISKNPSQIKKEIKTVKTVTDASIHLWHSVETEKMLPLVLESLEGTKEHPSSVYLLGRTRYNYPDSAYINMLQHSYPHLTFQSSSVHQSKGLEADYIVVCDVKAGHYGFPSARENDPMLDYVLAEKEAMVFAEERRLFYVALTRAKKEVHILSSIHSISPFIQELREDKVFMVEHQLSNQFIIVCPQCQRGILTTRKDKNGKSFIGCTMYSTLACSYTRPIIVCETCRKGNMVFSNADKLYHCDNELCHAHSPSCPKCLSILVLRTNKKDGNKFLGCSGYKPGSNGCDYTQSLRPKFPF